MSESPADLLRRAADWLEELNRAATDGPWLHIGEAVAVPVDECTCRASGREGLPHQENCGHEAICYPYRVGDAPLIATLRQVGGPVADWLRTTADRTASGNMIHVGRGIWLEPAVAVARAILGEDSS